MKSALLLMVWLAIPVFGFSATIHVPADYSSVQEALDAAVSGDTVLVAPGTYDENLHFVNSGVALKSSHGPHETMIRGNSDTAITMTVWFDTGVTDAVLEGFTITSTGGDVRGVYCHIDSAPTIANNIITGNTVVGGGAGIYCYFSTPMIVNNLIYDNTVLQGGAGDYVGGGIFLTHASPTIMNNTICHNHAPSYGGGIASKFSDSQALIINSIIWGNTPDQFYNFSGGNPQVSFSVVNQDPLFVSGPRGDYYLSQIAAGQLADSPCVDAGSDEASALGMDTIWTRMDEVADTGWVDIGFHHFVPTTVPATVNVKCFTAIDNKYGGAACDRLVGKGSIALAPGAMPFDPDADDVVLTINGDPVTIPAGSFEEKHWLWFHWYSFSGSVAGADHLYMSLNFECEKWCVKIKGKDAAPVFAEEGVTLSLAVGANEGEDSFTWLKKWEGWKADIAFYIEG